MSIISRRELKRKIRGLILHFALTILNLLTLWTLYCISQPFMVKWWWGSDVHKRT